MKVNYFFWSCIFGLSFLFLSFIVDKDVFRNIDYDVLVVLQNAFGRFIDLPFSLLTLLGSTEITISIVIAIFSLLFFRKKKIFAGIFFIFAIYPLELLGKILIYHPKPPVIFNRYVLNIFFPSSFIVETSYSYPSGHMARVTFITLVISFLLLKLIKPKFRKTLISVIAFFLILFMFISRIYLAEHWLSDVLGGMFLGGSLATLAMWFW